MSTDDAEDLGSVPFSAVVAQRRGGAELDK